MNQPTKHCLTIKHLIILVKTVKVDIFNNKQVMSFFATLGQPV
jgi:hypothetical protein